jgi:D-tyrosyl-tRNA(Tyr) deacylase
MTMRAVVQRVAHAAVSVDTETTGAIDAGLLVLLGVGKADNENTCRQLASKIARMRVFEDPAGKMNLSLLDTRGQALVVSQFTLYADTSSGLRPSFTDACEPGRARELYERFVSELACLGVPTRTGRFGARMSVELVNDGPVTLVLEETGKLEVKVKAEAKVKVKVKASDSGSPPVSTSTSTSTYSKEI